MKKSLWTGLLAGVMLCFLFQSNVTAFSWETFKGSIGDQQLTTTMGIFEDDDYPNIVDTPPVNPVPVATEVTVPAVPLVAEVKRPCASTVILADV